MKQFELINERLHEADMKKAVSEKNWKAVVEAIEPFYKESDSGKYGNIFEIITKLNLNGYKGNSCVVSPKGKVDVTYKGQKIEVKSNCGELDDITADIIIYTMDNKEDIFSPDEAHVLTRDNFFKVLRDNNLIRTTKKKNGYIKHNIQSYKNSKKRSHNFMFGLFDYELGNVALWK